MASTDGASSVRAQLVRLIHGDEHPDGPGFIERPVASSIDREWPVRKQYIQKGNFLRVADPQGRLAPTGPFTLHAYIFPTLPEAGRQVLLGRWSVDATSGFRAWHQSVRTPRILGRRRHRADAVAAEVKLIPRLWYFVAASYDPASGLATIYQEAVINRYNSLLSKVVPYDYQSHVSETLRVRPAMPEEIGFVIGAATERNAARGGFFSQCYNGKIDRCGVQGAALDRAALDAVRRGGPARSRGRARLLGHVRRLLRARDRRHGGGYRSPSAARRGLQSPGARQTGWNWSGRNDSFRLSPREYGGIELHADALIDCHWEPTLTLTVPDQLKSGVYAIKLTAGRCRGIHTLLRPSRPTQQGGDLPADPDSELSRIRQYRLGVRRRLAAGDYGRDANFPGIDIEVYKNDVEFGLSTYDPHNDGAGVCYSSYRRPIINLRPKYRAPGLGATWQFPADLSIVAWLEAMKYDYDVLTDEDLHREGVAALKPYRVVLNCTHNEYYSERMMDATEDYLATGGRLLQLGANSHYWCVGFRDEEPWVMEVRKLEAGSRAWQARPGEHYLASTGERSGLWRHRGRPPQKLIGVGFTSEGMDHVGAVPPHAGQLQSQRRVDVRGRRGEVFGSEGLGLGGAAGIEIDRYDLALGTPPHARILASSEPFTDNYPLVQEEIYLHDARPRRHSEPSCPRGHRLLHHAKPRRRIRHRLDRLGQRSAVPKLRQPDIAADEERGRRVPQGRAAPGRELRSRPERTPLTRNRSLLSYSGRRPPPHQRRSLSTEGLPAHADTGGCRSAHLVSASSTAASASNVASSP